MNRPFVRTFCPVILGAALAAFSGASALAQDQAGQAPPQQNSAPAAQGQRTDGQVEMDVVKALDASSALKDDLITAATIQSEVTLSGTVASQADKDLAGSIASHVSGVTKVHNNLQIGNPQQAAQDQGYSIGLGDDSQAPPPAPSDQAGRQSQAQQPQPEQPDQAQQNPPYPDSSLPPYGGQPQDQNQGAYPPPPQGPGPYPNQYPQPYPGQGQPQDQGQYPPYPGPNQAPYGQQPQPYPGPNQAPYGQQPQPYPGPDQQYGQQPQPYPGPNQPSRRYNLPSGPVTVPSGTLIQVRTTEAVSSKRAGNGTPVQFTVIRDVTYGGVLAIPRGATLHGVVTESEPAQTGKLAGSPQFGLTLTSLDLGGKTYPVQSDEFRVKGPNKAGYTAGNVVGGAVLGAIIGGMAGGGDGAAIGAGVGAGAGTAASAATRGPNAWIPPEAQVTFHLSQPLTVDPVSEQEAARLAQGLNPGGPNLYRRRGPYGPYGPYPYGPYPYYYRPYGPYMYGPPVYYRPYYMMGGVYYWR
ncbi:MAG TPA: BON domain-containing protein [Terracidiphilus sp.]|nr:BON domain-containing protein [Terracidiphilus sp.]